MVRRLIFICAALAIAVSMMPRQSFAEMKYKAGFYERLRHEFWLNNRDLNAQAADAGDRNFFRFKTSIWGQADYDDLASFYAKVTNEWKAYPYYGGNTKKGFKGDPDEIIIDNLYMDLKKPGGLPVTFRVGRQDLIGQYGESFLIADGTPGDGSRTFYFNAVKASWEIDPLNTLDMIGLNNPHTDQWAIIKEAEPATAVSMTDESGFIVDLKNKAVKDLFLEPYYIYKHEGGGGAGLQALTGRIHTVGAFARYAMSPWTFRVQLADQFGDYGPYDRQAVGGYGFIDRDFKSLPFAPVLSAGYVYLSGDNKNTDTNEGWNPLFCRFPIWSEIVPQVYQSESGNSYWTNLQMYRTQALFQLTKKAKLLLNYSFLRANELMSPAGTLFGTGKNRGNLYQAKVDYAFTKNVSGYILSEYFNPGNFYASGTDGAIFTRTQLEIKF